MSKLVYAVHDHGGDLSETRSAFTSADEALAQVVHDARTGQGVPLRIEDANGRTLVDSDEIQALAGETL